MHTQPPAHLLIAALMLVSCAGQQRSNNVWNTYDYGSGKRTVTRDYDSDYQLPATRSGGCVDDAPGCF